jgi:hypothetical protein
MTERARCDICGGALRFVENRWAHVVQADWDASNCAGPDQVIIEVAAGSATATPTEENHE